MSKEDFEALFNPSTDGNGRKKRSINAIRGQAAAEKLQDSMVMNLEALANEG